MKNLRNINPQCTLTTSRRLILLLVLYFASLTDLCYAQSSCLTNILTINTGYNTYSSSQLGNGATDRHWWITYLSPTLLPPHFANTPPFQAFVDNSFSTWATHPSSNWISFTYPSYYNTDTDSVYVMTCTRYFKNCEADSYHFVLNIADDNYVSSVTVDGGATSYFSQSPSNIATNYSTFHSASFSLYLTAGTHHIDVVVNNFAQTMSGNGHALNIYGTITGNSSTLVREDSMCANYVCGSGTDSSCHFDSTLLNITSLGTDSNGNCLFAATATVVTSSLILGYQWTVPGQPTHINYSSSSTNTQTFSLSSGSGGTVTYSVYAVNTHFQVNTDPCCHSDSVSQDVSCSLIDTNCADSIRLTLSSLGTTNNACNFLATVHLTPHAGYTIVGYWWQVGFTSPTFSPSNFWGFSMYSPTSTVVNVTAVLVDGHGDTCKISRSIPVTCFSKFAAARMASENGEGIKIETRAGSVVTVYPNPNDGQFTISSLDEIINNVQIFDVTGKKIVDNLYKDREVKISLQNISTGTYFIKVNNSIGKLITVIK